MNEMMMINEWINVDECRWMNFAYKTGDDTI